MVSAVAVPVAVEAGDSVAVGEDIDTVVVEEGQGGAVEA